jgi:hemerythrin-like domain-containing protein
MPIVIGGKPESHFSDPVGLLTDCHRRIERFLSVLARLGKDARGGALGQEQRAALETALRYFREAAPKHTADEEESLFPRLRAVSGTPDVQAALDRVEALESDHQRADLLHAEVDRLGSAWLVQGSLPSAEASRFSGLLAELVELYRAHIAVEEGEVFPLAGAALPPADRAAIGREMAARRGLKE